jgi:hypothetical protein
VIKTMRVPVPNEYAFPFGCLCLGVDMGVDFDKPVGYPDRQAYDETTGLRVWVVTVLDLDPEATRFGRQQVKVKVLADVRPVPPAPTVPGYPPAIEFTELIATPWLDESKCSGELRNGRHKCRGKLLYALRATGITAGRITTPVPELASV